MSTNSLIEFIWSFVRRQKWAFLGVLATTMIWALDTALWPVIVRVVVDIFTRFDMARKGAWSALQVPMFWSIALWLAIEVGFRIQGFVLARALPKLESEIRMTMFDHVQRHSPKYFNDQLSGSLANKINDIALQVSRLLRTLLVVFIPAFLAALVACTLLFRIHPLFAGLLITWLFLHFGVTVFFSRGCDRRENIHAEVRSQLMGKIVDSLTNHFVVNLYYRFDAEKRRLLANQAKERQTNEQALTYIEVMRSLLGAMGCLINSVVINGLLIFYWIHGELTTGEAVQVFNTVWNITMVTWISSSEIPGIFQSIGVAKQALELLQDPQDIADVPNAHPLVVSKGEIVFDAVAFCYGPQRIFENKSVRIAGGSKVGLVGFSGAGKSTFISLILRLYSAEKGRIMIDGQDIANVTLQSLRSQLSLIPQDPLLFHRSLSENIRFGRPDATLDEVIEAATKAHCLEFIRRQPYGFETKVGERGAKLSGGERQRIAIARALLANTPILLLDEATSALDSITERVIQDSLQSLMTGRTSLVIAHRLSTLENMDRILVFDQGKIVEDGSHHELLRLGEYYAKMWNMQAGGFLPQEAL